MQGMITSRWRLLEAVLEVCLSQQGLGWSPGCAALSLALLPGLGDVLARWTEVAGGYLPFVSALGRLSGPCREPSASQEESRPHFNYIVAPREAGALLQIVLLPLYCYSCL